MAKFLSRLFSSGSSSPKRGSFHSSQPSINTNSQRTGASSNMRPTSSLENLSSYHINSKELEKNKLHKASWEGNMNKVVRLARPGQIDQKDQQSRTPLHLAVVKGHLGIVKYLVHEGARLDVVDNEQRTPLVKAVLGINQDHLVNYQICVTLLDGGAHAFINAVDVHGKNALHYAIDFGNIDLVSLFLQVQNCDPNFRDRDQMTPLHLAVKRNNPNIVDVLLFNEHRQQADANLVNRLGHTPLHMAAIVGHTEIIRVLLQPHLEEPCDPTIVDSQQLTAYQIAKANHQETCAKLIDEYQQSWTRSSAGRETSGSVNEQEINPVVINPSQHFVHNQDESSDDTSSRSSSQSSKSSSRKIQRPFNQWSDQTVSSTSAAKDTRTLADMIKHNPLQRDIPETKPGNQTLSSLMHNIPLQTDMSNRNVSKPNTVHNIPSQSDIPLINVSKPTNQSLSSLIHTIPLQPNETSTSKPVISQQKQPPSIFGIGPVLLQHKESDNTSTSMSIEKPLIATNLIAGQTVSSTQNNVTVNTLINSLPQPIASNSNSWTHDSTFSHRQEQPVKQAKKIEQWDDSSTTQSDDDDHTGVYQTKTPPPNFPKQQPLSPLNGTSIFTTTKINENYDESRSEEDSIEAAVQKLNTQQAAGGIQNLVNKQLGNSYKLPQQTSIPNAQSPLSEDSSWSTTSSAKIHKESTTKGIHTLIQQQPLLNRKPSEPLWDDSRPLSADLKRSLNASESQSSSNSDDSDIDHDNKSSTIMKSPYKNPALPHLVPKNIQPIPFTETKTTGVENLAKIIETIMNSQTRNQNLPTSPKTINQSVISPLIKRNDSSSSNASSIIDDTVRSLALTTIATTNIKQQLYTNGSDQQNWPEIKNDGHDFKLITRNHSNEMTQQSHRQSTHASMHHELNNLRGSMSSSTSSIQNNMERLSELKEDIKQIERKQEDSLELKRQLKDMEIKKNNFEALYKKNDQLLRETETKLEKEINEKQRLEWTTKNLNMELKSVKQKLQSLEDEKSILNQRCVKLKEERDNYDEKLRIHQANTLQTAATGVLREEDIEKIKLRHREEMKLLSAENDDLHQRTKRLQSDLQLHKESLDVTIRYKIDLEKALEEKTFLQHELDRLKHEKDFLEQEKIDYKIKNENLQEEIRLILSDRSKLEQKLTNDSQEQMKQRQRSTDDIKKYRTQIEQLNVKLGDAEARLLVLQTQNEVLNASKDRNIKNEFETLTQRLNMIESEKLNAEQRYHNEQREIANKQQQHVLHEPLVILTSTPLNNAVQHQHSSSSPCVKCDTLQRHYNQEHEQRLQTEKDNERLRDVVSRQKQQQQSNKSLQQQQENEHSIAENSRQIRSDTERVKYELDRLRHDFDKLVLNYDPPNNLQQQTQLHSQIDSLRQFYEQEYRQKQSLISKLNDEIKPTNGYHRLIKHDDYEHSINGNYNCSTCSNSRLLKERLENAIDTSLADQRIQTIKQIPILPRQTTPLTTTTHMSSVEILRKRYYI